MSSLTLHRSWTLSFCNDIDAAADHRRCVTAAATAAARHANGDKVACHGARALGHLLAVSPGAAADGEGTAKEPAAVQQALQVLISSAAMPQGALSW